ncbi:MAG: YafY family transcriptional regulator [Mycobacterium sp.]|nr:YafY family transcriptional regulator [Mycobacterium sp.]
MATRISKVERQTNLVIALLTTRGFLTAERIRQIVIGYGDCPTDEAFARIFERDKSELRDLGIPVETGRSSAYDTTDGYRIKRDSYALPDIALTPAESAAVAVATTLWESPERITATQNALLKLRAAGVDIDPVAEVAITTGAGPTGLRGSEGVLGALHAAIEAGQAVQFEHRPNPVDPYTTRTVEPWGVVTAQGRWYLVGHDRDRDATRIFRLSRIRADVTAIGPRAAVTRPDGVDLRALVNQSIGAAAGRGVGGEQVRVWVADGRAIALRRVGRVTERRTIAGRDGDVLEIDDGAPDWLAREIAGHGADALVLEPGWLRENVIARLAARARL